MEVIEFTASDGVSLHGWLQNPAPGSSQLVIDAVVYLHGAGGNFYGSSLLRGFAPAVLASGVAVLSINTRGHDLAANLKTLHGGRRGGAAFEVVDECRHDVHGAVDWLTAQGLQHIALVGHSLGAIKAVYSQVFAPHSAVKFVVALSPPRLSYATFSAGPRRDEFRELIARAESHVAAGRPQELLEVTLPLPLLISAAAYLDKYGPDERYNIVNMAMQTSCPTLFTFGAQELASGNAAFTGLDVAIRNLAATSPSPMDVEIISGADHFYTGCVPRLVHALLGWPRWHCKSSRGPAA
jgi:pimeloyl-ACP methyl ester carboxylesterase